MGKVSERKERSSCLTPHFHITSSSIFLDRHSHVRNNLDFLAHLNAKIMPNDQI